MHLILVMFTLCTNMENKNLQRCESIVTCLPSKWQCARLKKG